jgi:hypothetical protein
MIFESSVYFLGCKARNKIPYPSDDLGSNITLIWKVLLFLATFASSCGCRSLDSLPGQNRGLQTAAV